MGRLEVPKREVPLAQECGTREGEPFDEQEEAEMFAVCKLYDE